MAKLLSKHNEAIIAMTSREPVPRRVEPLLYFRYTVDAAGHVGS